MLCQKIFNMHLVQELLVVPVTDHIGFRNMYVQTL